MNKILLFLFVSITVIPCILFANERPDLLDNFLDGLNTFKVDFVQTLLNERGETIEVSNGIVYMQQPGRFRWVYLDPYSQMIITDGHTLWIYDEDLEQVTIRDITHSLDETPASILSGQKEIEKQFVVIDMGNIDGFNWIELTPRDIENQYKSIRLGFDNDKIGMMILFDNLGQVTRIDFSGQERNPELDDGLFFFEPPEEVDVIDDRTQNP